MLLRCCRCAVNTAAVMKPSPPVPSTATLVFLAMVVKMAPVPTERVTGRAGRRTGAGAARQSNLNTRRTTDRPLRFIVKSSCLVDSN